MTTRLMLGPSFATQSFPYFFIKLPFPLTPLLHKTHIPCMNHYPSLFPPLSCPRYLFQTRFVIELASSLVSFIRTKRKTGFSSYPPPQSVNFSLAFPRLNPILHQILGPDAAALRQQPHGSRPRIPFSHLPLPQIDDSFSLPFSMFFPLAWFGDGF